MLRQFLPLLLFLCTGIACANNIQVTNVVLTDQNTTTGTTVIEFDLSWENSWRIGVGPANYDAAWVFAKFRVGGGPWGHATIVLPGSNPSGVTIDVQNNLGAFVYRSGDGSGDLSVADVRLVWQYAADGLDEEAIVDVQVFALEMVYVPEGSFQLGTGSDLSTTENEAGEFYRVGPSSLTRVPFDVASEDAITVGVTAGNLYYPSSGGGVTSGDQLGPIPAGYPKGFAAFYCAKYETSQDQYVAFFNTLTPTQRTLLDVTGGDGKNTDGLTVRNGVSWDESGAATTSLPDVPLNYVSNDVALAYLDWAGLRLLTELEFEKAGRGVAEPIQNEFAWGTTSIYGSNYTLVNTGTESEVIGNPGGGTGNAMYSSTVSDPSGPLRCGTFAASIDEPNREETGGSYYGIMELSGNLYERLISVGNPEGRAFTGLSGDGRLSASGQHNVAGWPTTNAGLGYRGGSHSNGALLLRLSDRNDAATVLSGSNSRLGFRAARTAN